MSNSLLMWLRGLSGSRKHRRAQTFPIAMNSAGEALEQRVLLAAPVAVDANYATTEDMLLNDVLTGTDADADPLTYSLGSVSPSNGSVFINPNGAFTYIPNSNFTGSDSFSFIVNDGSSNSAEGTATIDVNAVNDPPTVIDGEGSPSEDLAFPGSLVALATEVDGDTLTYSVVTNPTHGTVTVNANGSFTYTPSANYNGTDSFTFKVNDGTVDSNVGTFNLNVIAVDDPFTVSFPSGTPQVQRTSSLVRIDPAASVGDIDSTVSFANTHIRASIFSGNSNGDNQKGRVSLKILSQANGPGAVTVVGSKIFYDGQPNAIARFSGGTFGRALVIKFTSAATSAAVNAVLKQISIQCSFRAVLGTRQISFTISTPKLTAQANKSVTVV